MGENNQALIRKPQGRLNQISESPPRQGQDRGPQNEADENQNRRVENLYLQSAGRPKKPTLLIPDGNSAAAWPSAPRLLSGGSREGHGLVSAL